MSFETDIKQFAHSTGLDVVAVGNAEPYLEAQQVLEDRRERGLYPHFTEGDIDLRCQPERLLPGTRSVIAAGISYLTEDRSRPTRGGADPKGAISRYAWGRDYHHVLRERLEKVADYISETSPGDVQCQVFVDTGPPVDREAARRAGLGWFGKNAMLYVPEFGSWVFLGTIFTTVELTPDPQVTLDCGTCNRCITACPTQAITEPFQVDPHRCIGQLAQMPGQVPADLREGMGLRVFGCDVCQEVCPWNDEAATTNRLEFRPLPGVGSNPSLISLLLMSKREFREWIGPTPMAWRGKKTLQRNAAIALGNARNSAAVPALRQALHEDAKPTVRGAAAWALGRIGDTAAHAALTDALSQETDSQVREEIEAALS